VSIFIPPSHKIHDEGPRFACTLCPAVFGQDERHQFERHVLAHPVEDMHPHSPKTQAPGLWDPYHESGDVEWQRFIDRKNAEDPDGWRRWMKTSE
jgi:cytosine/adenosine deaminase-related metal-dependent hydrolase